MYRLIAEYTCDHCHQVQQVTEVAGYGDKYPDGWFIVSAGPTGLRWMVCSLECLLRKIEGEAKKDG